MTYKLGLKPVLTQPPITLADYYTPDLPSVESIKFPLGHADLIEPHLYMNDKLGCCAESGSVEEVRLANALRGVTVNFTDDTVVQNYTEIAGYDPADPASDHGTDVHVLYDYRKTTGIVDADDNRHKIVGYAGLPPNDPDAMLVALAAGFDIGAIGFQVPIYAQDQFEAGEPWHLVQGRAPIIGGHYVPIVGATDRHTFQLFTWGKLHTAEATFIGALCTVAVVALTEEMFTAEGKSPEGIDFEKLAARLAELDTAPVSTKAPRKRSRARVSVDGVDQGEPQIGWRPDDSHPGEQISGSGDAEPAH